MKKTITYILLSFSFILFSQNAGFKGTVIDLSTTNAVKNAVVTIEGTDFKETTNIEGKFVFYDKIPLGEQIVTVNKDKYETKYFIIDVIEGKQVIADKVGIDLSKEEKARQKKKAKYLETKIKEAKKQKEADAKKSKKHQAEKLKKLKKQNLANNKKLEKEKKRLKKLIKQDNVVISYDSGASTNATTATTATTTQAVKFDAVTTTISPVQEKYGALFGVSASTINGGLYEFIDDWMGTAYLLGGATKDGIDCSSFSQRLYAKIYDSYIERTAEKQYKSKNTDKFRDPKFLQEGDLIFFKGSGDNSEKIVHVGVYLQNNKFINSTSRKGNDGVKGVKISNLSDSFWRSRFVAGGRRSIINE